MPQFTIAYTYMTQTPTICAMFILHDVHACHWRKTLLMFTVVYIHAHVHIQTHKHLHVGAKGSAGITVWRADPNVIALQFNKLLEPKDVYTGDHVFCGNTNCSVAHSFLSCTNYAAGMTVSYNCNYTW